MNVEKTDHIFVVTPDPVVIMAHEVEEILESTNSKVRATKLLRETLKARGRHISLKNSHLVIDSYLKSPPHNHSCVTCGTSFKCYMDEASCEEKSNEIHCVDCFTW
jgi:hypothetical protein